MKKHLLFFLAFSLYPSRSTSQTIDKERLTEYFQNQQFEDAIDYLNRFSLKDSNSLQLLNYLGYAYYMNDEKGKAKIYYLKLLNSDPENISANQYLANICISENNNDSAKIFVQRLIGLAPRRANFYRILAGIYKKDQQTDSAIFYYNRAYLLAPSDSKNIIALADYSIDVTNYRKADSILKIALTNDSLNVSYLKLQIQSFYESKNYKGIVWPGEKLIGLEELSIPILSKLVFAYYSLRQFQDCIRVCELMDSNRLAGESTYYYESRSWSMLNKPVLSNELLEKCLSYSISKTSELYYFSLAQNNESLKNYKSAVTDYDTA